MADGLEADFLDPNEDICGACAKTGVLLCCDACPAAYHHRCVGYGAQFFATPPFALTARCRMNIIHIT